MKKKYQLPAIILALGLGFGLYTFYSFSTEEIPKLEQRLREKETVLNNKNGELRRLRQFSDNIEAVKLSLRELNVQLEAALESMPRNYDLSGLLRRLSVIGFNTGVELSAFKPGLGAAKEGEFYETTLVTFNLQGSFSQVLSFFDQVLRLKRIVRIDRVALRSVSSNARGNTGTLAHADVTAKLYRFVD